MHHYNQIVFSHSKNVNLLLNFKKVIIFTSDSELFTNNTNFYFKHEKIITCLFSSTSSKFISISLDGTINIWKKGLFNFNNSFQIKSGFNICSAIRINDNIFACGDCNGKIIIFKKNKIIKILENFEKKPILSLVYFEKNLACLSNSKILIWNFESIIYSIQLEINDSFLTNHRFVFFSNSIFYGGDKIFLVNNNIFVIEENKINIRNRNILILNDVKINHLISLNQKSILFSDINGNVKIYHIK